MQNEIVVAVDAMGGDFAPGNVLDGVKLVLGRSSTIRIALVGPEEAVSPFCEGLERVTPVFASEVISMDEHPAQAVRRKKDSSIVVGCNLVKQGSASGFFSAGSTGACLAGAILHIGRIKGVARPALATMIPCPAKPVLLCDVGANADCKPEYLVQFAQMARVYFQKVVGVQEPSVGLLNIGAEETKGTQLVQDAYQLMSSQVPGFAGNIEGRGVMAGECDIVVADGFSGNICLKTMEGTAAELFRLIKGVMKKSPLTMLGALTMKSGLYQLKDTINPDALGGAPLLGVKGACIVGHGSSSPEAICNGILATAQFASLDVSGSIANVLAGDMQ